MMTLSPSQIKPYTLPVQRSLTQATFDVTGSIHKDERSNFLELVRIGTLCVHLWSVHSIFVRMSQNGSSGHVVRCIWQQLLSLQVMKIPIHLQLTLLLVICSSYGLLMPVHVMNGLAVFDQLQKCIQWQLHKYVCSFVSVSDMRSMCMYVEVA